MSADRIPWHPGFASAVQLELDAYRESLVFETEHELNRQPLRIDLLVVKKDPRIRIENDIAAEFLGHNIMEFKSEQDSLTIDDLSKSLAYGHLYKAYGSTVDAIRFDDVTVTLVRRRRPKGLFDTMASYGYDLTSTVPGIYQSKSFAFPVQVIVTEELDAKSHIWLASLASNLETLQVRRLISAAAALKDQGDRELADAVMNVVAMANTDTIERLMEEDDMYKTLREIMQPEFDKATAIGIEKGMEKGIATAQHNMVERLLRRKSFSEAEVADLTGVSLAEVQSIAGSLGAALA